MSPREVRGLYFFVRFLLSWRHFLQVLAIFVASPSLPVLDILDTAHRLGVNPEASISKIRI